MVALRACSYSFYCTLTAAVGSVIEAQRESALEKEHAALIRPLLEEPTSTNVLPGKRLHVMKIITSKAATRMKRCEDDSYMSL